MNMIILYVLEMGWWPTSIKLCYVTIRVAKTKALISFAVNREAVLRLCFRLCRLLVFPCGGSNVRNFNTTKLFDVFIMQICQDWLNFLLFSASEE